MHKDNLQVIISSHGKWLLNDTSGSRADLRDANLRYADLSDADLRYADLRYADLSGANLRYADLSGANLFGANLRDADLSDANLRDANLRDADLRYADLRYANLRYANLRYADLRDADLRYANLRDADLRDADLRDADLSGANLCGAKNLVKIMGVEPGNFYWKAIGENLVNMGYRFNLGLNVLLDGEEFASDERVTCSYPGFHFASKSWCQSYYSERRYLCKIRIPEDAQINEPWATDGKASADKIEIVQILLMETEEDVTKDFVVE